MKLRFKLTVSNMKKKLFKGVTPLCILFSLLYIEQIYSISLVYNMKIRRAFFAVVPEILLQSKKKSRLIATAVPVIYKRDRHFVDKDLKLDICEKRFTSGSLFNFRYIYDRTWWIEGATGLEREHVKTRGTKNFDICRTGFDDIVFAGGYNIYPTKESQVVIYGLAGFPTRRKVNILEAQDPLVGTRFFGIGVGSEFSYSFINAKKQSLVGIFQNRFIHFFNRRFFPILPCDAKIQPGNVSDLLFTLQYRYKKNLFETGYNPSFFTNRAVILNTGEVEVKSFVRNSGYFTYSRLFKSLPIIHKPGLIGVGLSVASSKLYETKILSSWLNFTAVF